MKIKWIGVFVCIIVCIGCSKAEEGEWKGSVENENGIEVVLNPFPSKLNLATVFLFSLLIVHCFYFNIAFRREGSN